MAEMISTLVANATTILTAIVGWFSTIFSMDIVQLFLTLTILSAGTGLIARVVRKFRG